MKRSADEQEGGGSVTVVAKRARTLPMLRLNVVPQAKKTSQEPGQESPLQALQEGLEEVESRDRYRALVRVETHTATLGLGGGEVRDMVGVLLGHIKTEGDKIVLMKVIELLAVLAKHPSVNAAMVIDALLPLAENHSKKVRAQLLSTLHTIACAKTIPGLSAKAIRVALSSLPLVDAVVRSRALALLAALADVAAESDDADGTLGIGTVQQIVGGYFGDDDPRVRTAAFQAMFSLHQRGVKLRISLYDAVVEALRDDYSSVRIGAMTLVWVLGSVYGTYVVQRSEGDGQDLLMVDDGFAKLCNMVNDEDVAVRVQACQLLGSMHGVNIRFLAQTLDKKVMSHLRRKKTAHEERADKSAPGGINPEGDTEFDPEEIAIMDSGACGAFVHGLEDEFYEVRSAALDAICELSASVPEFGRRALDFLVDMFNDEIDDVRMSSMHCLRKISDVVEFSEEQVQIILGVLDEDNPRIRIAIHGLLGSLRLANVPGLQLVTQSLLSTLKRFPDDHPSVWSALQALGTRHPVFVELLVEQLLNINSQFAPTEADVDDIIYIGQIVLLYNAASINSNIVALCPAYTRAHYRYLRDQWPHYFPDLKLPSLGQIMGTGGIQESQMRRPPAEGTRVSEGEEQCLNQAVAHVQRGMDLARAGLYTQAEAVWESATRDLTHILEMSPRLLALARFHLTTLRCLQALAKIQRSYQEGRAGGRGSPQAVARSARALIRHTYQMEHVYSGLGAQHQTVISDLRLCAYAALLLATNQLETTSSYDFKRRVDDFVEFADNLAKDRDANWALAGMGRMAGQWAVNPTRGAQDLAMCVAAYQPVMPAIEGTLRMIHGRLSAGIGSIERPYSYPSTIPINLPVRGTIENLLDPSRLRIQVMLGNGTVVIARPAVGQFQPLGGLFYRLSTTVPITLPACSDPCTVQIRLALSYPEEEYLPLMAEVSSQGLGSSESGREGYVALWMGEDGEVDVGGHVTISGGSINHLHPRAGRK